MAVATSTIWEFNASATASMVNGGGFNYQATGPINNASWGSANTSTPTVSTATYTFVAGDVGHWVYSVSTAFPGFYKITSVGAGVATLDAAVGAGVIFDTTTNRWLPNTTAGVDTTSSPSGQSILIDYSQATAGILSLTDGACTTPSTTFTSATGGFTPAMVGNVLHINSITGAGTLVGWYEIVGYTNTNTITLDRTPAPSANATAANFIVGGALSGNASTEDAFYEQVQGGNTVWWKSGNYTAGGGISIASTASTGAAPCNTIGYTSVRGDTCTGANRPNIALGANTWAFGQFQNFTNLSFTGTAITCFQCSIGSRASNIKVLNSSTTADRAAFICGTDGIAFNCEAVSQLGRAFNIANSDNRHIGCYAHNSKIGFFNQSTRNSIHNCLSQATYLYGLGSTTTCFTALNCTFHGFATPRSGSFGVNIAASIDNTYVFNCIVDGWATGIAGTTSQRFSNRGAYNNFYNNTTTASLYSIDVTDISLNPSYTNVTELTGSTATTSGSVLTQSGGDFSTVTDNVDYVYIVSGTGITAGMYLITSHTSTTITLNNAPGANATADKVWVINTGKDLSVGTNMKAAAFPGVFPGSSSTSYLDIGAVQRQEPAGGGSGGSYTFAG